MTFQLVTDHEPVLGTRLSLKIRASSRAAARRAEESALTEIARLEQIFSVFRPDSELSRWRSSTATADHRPGRELTHLLDDALAWHHRSAGVFNPAVGCITARWTVAQAAGTIPPDAELQRLAAQIARPRYGVEGGVIHQVGDCTTLNFNAIAKGTIVDCAGRAAAAVDQPRLGGRGIHDVVVNIGGDLVHRGAEPIVVGIENPQRPYDNEPPLARVHICNQGLATSGGTRRGFTIGGQRYSHVIDPRTARPVDHVISASVIAPSAQTADVVATILSVLAPSEGLEFVTSLNDPTIGCLIIGRDGTIVTNSTWNLSAVPTR